MASRKTIVVNSLLEGVAASRSAAAYVVNTASIDVSTLRRAIEGVVAGYENAENVYQFIVTKTGSSAAARTVIASELFSAPADVVGTLVAIRDAKNALLDGYSGLVHSQGARAFTWDSATSRHQEVLIPAATKTSLDTLFAGVVTACDVLLVE